MLRRVCRLLGFKSDSFQTADRNIIFDQGNTVPTDATGGYAVGALFLHRDGGEGTALYVNEGSESSCDFNAVAALTATQEALIGATAGTAAASKAVILDASKDIAGMNRITQGAFASLLQGSGSPLATATPYVLGVYADDAGASIAASVRTILARTLLTVDQTGGSIRSVMGQLKLATSVDVTSGIYTGVQGYVELVGATSAKTGSTFSCIDASAELGGVLTVDSGGEFAGLHVETTGAGTISVTYGGVCAGVLIDKASGAASWPVGMYIPTGCVRTPIRIGTWISNTASTGHVLASLAEDNAAGSGAYASAAVGVYCDDGGAAVTNITTPIYSRYLLTVDQNGGGTQAALYAQLKSAGTGTRTYTTGGIRGAYIFTQLGQTALVTSAELVTISAATTLASGGMAVGAGCMFAGLDVNLGGAGSISGDGVAAGVIIRSKDEGAVWPTGLYIKATAAKTPIQIGLWSSATKDVGYVPATAYADGSGCSAAIRVACDDGGDVGAGILAGIFSRYLLTVAQTGGATQTGLFAQFKSHGTLSLTTGSFTALKAYNQAGTITLATGAEYAIINAGTTLAGTMTVGSGCTFSGVDVNIGGAGTVTNSGTAAGVIIRSKGEGAVWPVGLHMTDVGGGVTQGINITATAQALYANVTAVAAAGSLTGSALCVYGAGQAGQNDVGIVAYLDATAKGLSTGNWTYGAGIWLNIDSTFAHAATAGWGGHEQLCPLSVGIYAPAAVGAGIDDNYAVYGIKAELVGDAAAPATYGTYFAALNVSQTAGGRLAIFFAHQGEAVGLTTAKTVAGGAMALADVNGTMYYVNVYTA